MKLKYRPLDGITFRLPGKKCNKTMSSKITIDFISSLSDIANAQSLNTRSVPAKARRDAYATRYM